MRTARGHRGFTLVELMVTLVLATVVLGSIYMIYAQSVVAYGVENQLLNMQERARFGLEHLKRDLRRAGFLATPNSVVDVNFCHVPGAVEYPLRAVTMVAENGTVHQPWPGANPNVAPTSITLFGDFFSGQIYKSAAIQDNRVFFQLTANFPANAAEFNRIFNRNRYLRIVTQDQFEVYIPVESADFAERSVTLVRAVPQADAGTLCGVTGFGEGLDLSTAGFLRYSIAADTRPNAPLGKTDLVREELAVDGRSAADPPVMLVIADYAVELQFYDFGMDDLDETGENPGLRWYQNVDQVADPEGGGMLGPTNNEANPQDLRLVTAKLTVRTEGEDPSYTMIPRTTPFAPLDGYETTQMEGACRTLSLATRVELSSLAVRNLKENLP